MRENARFSRLFSAVCVTAFFVFRRPTTESLHGNRKNTAETIRKTEASAHGLKRLWDYTAPIEI